MNTDPIPGLPEFDLDRVVHGSQSIEVVRPLPVRSGDGWRLKRRIIGVHENSEFSWKYAKTRALTTDSIESGIIVEVEALLVDPWDNCYARMVVSVFLINIDLSQG